MLARAIGALSIPDYLLMHRVHRWRAPAWVRWWAIAATRAGDGWLWGAVGLILLAMGAYLAVFAAALAVAAGVLIFLILKRAVGRTRPCHIEPHCWSDLIPPDRFSFPSGHSITAFAVATAISAFYPDIAGALLLCAAGVALSRILLGMHFLTDVVAGAALGAALGYSAVCLLR